MKIPNMTFMVQVAMIEFHKFVLGSLLSDMGGVLGFFLGVTMLNCIKETYSLG